MGAADDGSEHGGTDAQTSGQNYQLVVQLVMLYGSETWVLTLYMERGVGGFHNRVANKLTGIKNQIVRDVYGCIP